MAFLMERCGEMMVSVDSHKPVPAPFLTKTYQLVDDPCTDHIVSWGEDETTFVVWRPPEFARDLLPNYFKHNNFSSFVRQLNTYGFRKIVADRWEFANEFFRKGEKHLLSEIHRRKSPQVPHHYHHNHEHYHHQSPPPFQGPDETTSWIEPPPPLPSGDAEFLSALSEDNQRLKRKNSLLLSELTHMKKLYNDIIYFIQNHVTPVPPEQRLVKPRPSRLIELAPDDQLQTPSELQKALKNRFSATITGESGSTVKLFGVSIHGKKRLHAETAGGEN
ncbi:heat stress transcription factor B-4b [Cocos nucifera]|uniref:Heat stress transcription factor B-4b n=1 Tax=Cocos nucifera TaxID=13894 RepID=A0A8K0IRZ1_COCNU|nr:heat stress transcription factor B-4b [Cocos nucifera]